MEKFVNKEVSTLCKAKNILLDFKNCDKKQMKLERAFSYACEISMYQQTEVAYDKLMSRIKHLNHYKCWCKNVQKVVSEIPEQNYKDLNYYLVDKENLFNKMIMSAKDGTLARTRAYKNVYKTAQTLVAKLEYEESLEM